MNNEVLSVNILNLTKIEDFLNVEWTKIITLIKFESWKI